MAVVVSHAMQPRRLSSQDDSSCNLWGESSTWANKESGESALSRSMRYSDPWFYNSAALAGGFLLTPAFVLCACPDYINGTKRRSKQTVCKKCKGTRIPLPYLGGNAKFDTVRCYPTTAYQGTTGSSLRAGTMRVSTSFRPSILPAATDPYDPVRRSRLSAASSAYSTDTSDSRHISPSQGRNKTKEHNAVAKSKKGTGADSLHKSPSGRKSILECSINPYELMTGQPDAPESDSITLVNGQRIRIRPQTSEFPEYEHVHVDSQSHTRLSDSYNKEEHENGLEKTSPIMCNPRSPSPIETETECSPYKSILKKPFSDTDVDFSCLNSASLQSKKKHGSQFYLPTPTTSTQRKKVQFFVENDLDYEDIEDDEHYEDIESYSEHEQNQVVVEEEQFEPINTENEPETFKNVTKKLQRSFSERFRHEPIGVTFFDTTALRIKKLRTSSKDVFSGQDLNKLDGLRIQIKNSTLQTKPKTKNISTPQSESKVYPENNSINVIEQRSNKKVNGIIEHHSLLCKSFNETKEEEPNIIECKGGMYIKTEPVQNIKFSSDLVPKTGPPSAPPRKRSNNKQPVIDIKDILSVPEVKCSVSDTSNYLNKTVVQITPTPTVHKIQIKNDFSDSSTSQPLQFNENSQRKTSILINGDDCYSTINVNDDFPMYQSSVVVKDSGVQVPEVNVRKSSTVYITDSPIIIEDNVTQNHTSYKSVVISIEDTQTNNKYNNLNTVYTNEEYAFQNYCPSKNNIVTKREQPKKEDEKLQDKIKPTEEFLEELLRDPVEAVRRNLVPHVCGKADVSRRPYKNGSNSCAKILNDFFTDAAFDTNPQTSLEESFARLKSFDSLSAEENHELVSDDSSLHYELIDHGSDCYTDNSTHSSLTEEELANRSKFYELLADSTMTEISESEDHNYESIKINSDPIYEEIEIPPPLPSNPPPSTLLDDLKLDKEYTTRSIFEGASKYDILSYLVDAKERGIVSDCNSDSNEDNSLTESTALIYENSSFPKTADIERNDSGVGSETSKTSRSKFRARSKTSALCEDCDTPLEPGVANEQFLCPKCFKRRCERKDTIMEIVETEEKYSRDLQIILEEFYQPMLVAGLLTPEQLSSIFLNSEELLENSQNLAEKLRDAVEIATEQGDEDLLSVNIGKLFLEASPMLHGFETYCVRQGSASLLLASLEKEKELLRIFLRVSQMENTMLRRMNLNSFLMVPVQRVTKYPLLLARLHKVTPNHHQTREQLKESQHKIELHLNHINSETKDVPSKLWKRISSGSGRISNTEIDLVNIKLRKIAVDILEWNHDEAKFILEGKLLYTQPTDNNWRKGRTIKLSCVNAMLVINGNKPNQGRPDFPDVSELVFSRHSWIREAALLLVRDKNGRYSLLRDPLYLDRCIIAADPAWQSYFEVQEIFGKDTFIFKAEDEHQTKIWYQQLQFHAQGMGTWRKRRNALANIMISGMGLRN